MASDKDHDEDEEGFKPRWTTSPAEPTEAVRIIGPQDEPPLRFASDDDVLPHWTEPPTGEMPRTHEDDLGWTSTASAPVWRDERGGHDDTHLADLTGDLPIVERTDRPAGADPFLDDDVPVTVAVGAAGATPAAPLTAGRRVTTINTLGAPSSRSSTVAGDEGFTPTRGTGGRNLPVAVGVGVAIAGVFLALAHFGAKYLVALVVVVLGLASAELYDAMRKAGYQPAALVGIVACAGLPIAAYNRGAAGIAPVLFLAIAATLVWFLMSGGLEHGPMPNASATLFGVAYIGVLGSHAGLLLRNQHGVSALVTLAFATMAYDVFGLFVGSGLGRSPLLRWVSPNKTVEGLLGGIFGVFLVVALFKVGEIKPWNDRIIHTVQFAIVIAVAAPLGDLAESMLKRSLGVKDMGDLLPGHGGVLDRFDAYLFVLPAVYYLGEVLRVY